jgi:hypothetical protein
LGSFKIKHSGFGRLQSLPINAHGF